MSNTKSSTSGGIGLAGAVFLVFLILKLAEIGQVATWSWWWVTAPLWGIVSLVVAFFVIAGVFMLLKLIFTSEKKKEIKETFVPKKSAFMERLEEAQRKRHEAMEAEKKRNENEN